MRVADHPNEVEVVPREVGVVPSAPHHPCGVLDVSVPEDGQMGSGEDGAGEVVEQRLKKDKPRVRQTNGLFGFSDAEAIKERVRKAKLKPSPYSVHDLYHSTGLFQFLARHPYFENTTLAIIVLNAFWIMIDTDGNDATTMDKAKPMFVVADCAFFAYFSVELFVRFMAFQKKTKCLRDGWFVFDSMLVALYAFDPFTLGILAIVQGGKGVDLPTSVLRLFRLARLSRLVRMLRSLPQLMIMIKGMVTATSSVGYSLCLLMIITYVFAIALVNLSASCDSCPVISQDFFSTVPEAIHSLLVYGTFADELSSFIYAIKSESAACLVVTWVYVALSCLTVMNMLIGVLCEVITAVAVEEKEGMMVETVSMMLGDMVEQLDMNRDGLITWPEFQQILDSPSALRALESVNVDAESMVDMAEDFFFEGDEEFALTHQDFMEMVLDLRGGQQATVKDIMRSAKRVNCKVTTLAKRMDDFESKIDRKMSGIDEKLDLILSGGAQRRAG